MIFLAETVRTTGINWESIAVIAGSVAAVMSLIIGAFAKWISNQITGAINKFRIEVISQMDTRLTSVETKVSDIQSNTRRRLK
jgi:hypothetical protein